MIKVGLNGFGRIGKCVFLQLLNNPLFEICCLNTLNLQINEIADYLQYDSVHHYNKNFNVNVLSDNKIQINNHHIEFISEREAKNINWKKYGCEYLIDATGCYLTTTRCLEHNVDYVIMSSPAKDKTKTFIYGVNNNEYSGENIVSSSSCTTNALTPILKLLNNNYTIENCVFTTIHATTSTQYTVDIANNKLRTCRSIFNNIIPHTTGATSSVTSVLPELTGKINGTSVRVPVSNGSLLDVNISLSNKNITLQDIKNDLIHHPLFKIVYDVNEKNLVSCDFITTTTPTILDFNASIDMGNGNFKLMIWYDNEWSYSSQLIRLVETMFTYNNTIKTKYYIENISMENERVVCRVDFNVPKINNIVTDDFRITSAIPTIKTILSKNPKYLIIACHYGRPNEFNKTDSVEFMIPILEKYLNMPVTCLHNGICEETLNYLNNNPSGVFLLENLRFHKEETYYEKNEDNQSNIINMYNQLGDVFICDAFGCLHRKHMSIYGIKYFNKKYGYGHLIKKELENIDILLNSDKKILSIIGGNKIQDKLPLINSLKNIKNSHVFIGGGLAKQYNEKHSNIIIMNDGFGNKNLNEPNSIYIDNIKNPIYNIYDIGTNSLNELIDLVNVSDIIFWNGTLGVIEHDIYKLGSLNFLSRLEKMKEKTIIIGGGETASLISKNNILQNDHIYISTGGGALLEYLQNKILYGKNLVGLKIYI